MANCPKCNGIFEPKGKWGVRKFCSSSCANSRSWNAADKLKKSISAKNSDLVKASIIRANLASAISKKNNNSKIPKIFWKCLYCGDVIITTKKTPRKYHYDCYKKCSGGYRKGSGFGKSGWFKGIWCDSSYELAWVIYNIDHNIQFTRNTEGFEYFKNGIKCKYYPDFIIGSTYIEIKGYYTEEVDIKSNNFPHELKILYKSDLKEIFEYVISKYGSNFIEVYESNPHKKRNNQCKICNKPATNIYCSRRCTMKGNNKWINPKRPARLMEGR